MRKSLIAVAAAAGLTAGAGADVVSGTITADNHYALFTSRAGVFTYQGGNETGPGGSPGLYNWSMAESYQFGAGNALYIAAWSDDAVAQGVLAQFQSDDLGTILSGDPRWEVYATNINRGDGDPHPGAAEIAAFVGAADAGNLWEAPFVGGGNGVAPWGQIAGITGEANWMWKNIAGDPDPLNGGSGEGEMLIFRTPIPAPAPAALVGIAGAAALRRRR